MSTPIEDHGIVGDLRTIALVGLDATIDFLCWPRFDSPSVFASLLDNDCGGRFELSPDLPGARNRQLYLPDTNVLLTRFLCPEGVAEISDFMAVGTDNSRQRLIRRAKAVRGTIRFHMRCLPAFDYGRAAADLMADGDSVIMSSQGVDATRLRLCAATPLKIDGNAVTAEFELEHGQSAFFTLEEASDDSQPISCAENIASDFRCTSDFWRAWTARSTYRGRWRDMVNRSALALKLLTSQQHGSIIAAATFGLPETLGGERNWDYRYTWIRDAAFTVNAFLRLEHVEEADAFMRWLHRLTDHVEADGSLQVMYRLDGGENLEETELTHFRGYRDSRPVRIGNGAADQLQLDIYGELLDAILLADRHGEQITYQAWQSVCRSLEYVEQHWRLPDEGIWEVRNGRREFLYSRLMCWVALDRGIRLARKRSLPAPINHWHRTRDEIHHSIHNDFWDSEFRAFVQYKGAKVLDASCLLMPLVRFISPTDPRWLSTLDAIGCELTDDSLVYRYSNESGGPETDGLTGIEGTFNMCSFWYVECLARAGELQKARFLFEKMLGYANHLGLFAEETGKSGEQLGNFPQAFTHLALISAAHYLDRALSA